MSGYREFREVSIHCPRCNKEANFDGEPYKFILKKDWENSNIVADKYYDWEGWMVIEKYPSLVPWNPELAKSIMELDKIYGVVKCLNCGHVDSIYINWPKQAYYQWNIRGFILWAINKNHALELLKHIENPQRTRKSQENLYLGKKLPAIALSKKNRDIIVKKMRFTLY